jgi:hypothetical protein
MMGFLTFPEAAGATYLVDKDREISSSGLASLERVEYLLCQKTTSLMVLPVPVNRYPCRIEIFLQKCVPITFVFQISTSIKFHSFLFFPNQFQFGPFFQVLVLKLEN